MKGTWMYVGLALLIVPILVVVDLVFIRSVIPQQPPGAARWGLALLLFGLNLMSISVAVSILVADLPSVSVRFAGLRNLSQVGAVLGALIGVPGYFMWRFALHRLATR